MRKLVIAVLSLMFTISSAFAHKAIIDGKCVWHSEYIKATGTKRCDGFLLTTNDKKEHKHSGDHNKIYPAPHRDYHNARGQHGDHADARFWHWSCVQDDSGKYHRHDEASDDLKEDGTGTWDEKCEDYVDRPDIVDHVHTLDSLTQDFIDNHASQCQTLKPPWACGTSHGRFHNIRMNGNLTFPHSHQYGNPDTMTNMPIDALVGLNSPQGGLTGSGRPDLIRSIHPDCNPVQDEICHVWYLDQYSLIGFPALFRNMRTFGEFHDFLRYTVGEVVQFSLLIDDEWVMYDNNDNELWRMPIEPHSAVWIRHKKPIIVTAEPVLGESITLGPGKHLLGFPEVPSAYSLWTDLLIDGVESIEHYIPSQGGWIVWTITVEGQAGDGYIEAGRAIIINVTDEVTFDLTSAPQAPMAQRQGALTMTWGAIKSSGN